MDAFEIALTLTILSCTLVAGLLFCFAVVVMPGIKTLDDKAFIQVFQVTDRIIQNNHPLFMLVWVGSIIAMLACGYLGLSKLQGDSFYLLLMAFVGYLVGVQLVTIVIHLPLNNRLQTLDLEQMSAEDLNAARLAFEPRWNRSNQIRTTIACGVSLLLIALAIGL